MNTKSLFILFLCGLLLAGCRVPDEEVTLTNLRDEVRPSFDPVHWTDAAVIVEK